jgi:hypothetical protein
MQNTMQHLLLAHTSRKLTKEFKNIEWTWASQQAHHRKEIKPPANKSAMQSLRRDWQVLSRNNDLLIKNTRRMDASPTTDSQHPH